MDSKVSDMRYLTGWRDTLRIRRVPFGCRINFSARSFFVVWWSMLLFASRVESGGTLARVSINGYEP
eukprot:906599-Amorphochlora_amoeboformis.AAC.1